MFKKVFHILGYDVIKLDESNSPFIHIHKFIKSSNPVFFDVGSNLGQTILEFKELFNDSIVYAFEPAVSTFEKLSLNVLDKYENLYLNNCALGSHIGNIVFNENSNSEMSSFLIKGNAGWGDIINKYDVKVDTIDNYCNLNSIDKIDCLKIDSQGFELEILKGAMNMIVSNKIGLVYFEVTFSEIYLNLPSFGDLFNFLQNNDFKLVSIYKMHRESNHLAAWTDVLFIHKSYLA